MVWGKAVQVYGARSLLKELCSIMMDRLMGANYGRSITCFNLQLTSRSEMAGIDKLQGYVRSSISVG